MLHQSPCWVPGTRRTKATPFPVRRALAGHIRTCWLRKVSATSITATVTRETRICAIAPGPVSVFVADSHGELVAEATMDGAAPDTRLNAQRKAYTAARSDARSTRELADKVRDDPMERASFDPFFTFFLGGVAVFDGDVRVGAVGVSGLPGETDEELALAAIERSAD